MPRVKGINRSASLVRQSQKRQRLRPNTRASLRRRTGLCVHDFGVRNEKENGELRWSLQTMVGETLRRMSHQLTLSMRCLGAATQTTLHKYRIGLEQDVEQHHYHRAGTAGKGRNRNFHLRQSRCISGEKLKLRRSYDHTRTYRGNMLDIRYTQ